MKIFTIDDVDYLKDVETKEGICNLISSSYGTVLLDYGDKQKTIRGQHLISEDEKIAEQVIQGLRTKRAIRSILDVPNLKPFIGNLLALNIYTFSYNVIDYKRFVQKFLMKNDFTLRDFRYIGYIYPPNIAITIEETQEVVHIPDKLLPSVSYGVREEVIFIVVDENLPKENQFTDLALVLIKQPILNR